MAIAIHTGHTSPRPVTPRPPWVRRRAGQYEPGLAAFMLLMLVVGVVALMVAGQTFGATAPGRPRATLARVASTRPPEGAQPASPPASGVPAEPAAAPAAAEPSAAEPAAPPPTLAVGRRARVAKTDGLGVVLHTAPRQGARIPAGLVEGTTVSVLELAGTEWARVQSDSRQAGWVPTAFLVPVE
jgi:hypothetical protein